MTAPILVTGATGSVGSSVVEQLRAAGARVRAGARRPGALHVPSDVETVELDLLRPETLGPALVGVEKVFLYVQPDGIHPFLAAAEQAGVEHIVLLSSHTVAEGVPEREPIAAMHAAVENPIVAGPASYTFLRPAHFASNVLLWGWDRQLRVSDRLRFPYPGSQCDAIHEEDIAAIGTVALTEPGHENKSYFITGPESVSQRQQLADIAAATGRRLEFDPIDDDEARIMLAELIPEWVMDATLGWWRVSDGVPAPLSDVVHRLTGRQARSFAEWAVDHAKDFT